MIRTRNFTLIGIALGVLGVLTVLFVSHTSGDAAVSVGTAISGTQGRIVEATEPVATVDDRTSFIARLRNEVAERLGEFSVATASVAATPDMSVATETASVSVSRTVMWCDATILESDFLAQWPVTGVAVQTNGFATIVSVTNPDTGTVAPLLQFPAHPARLGQPACLTHAYIGVTPEGRLIHNNDVILYQGYGAGQLVGYAFDGNPIYGTSEATEFDVCGGVSTASGYAYHVRPEESFILGCFVSASQQRL